MKALLRALRRLAGILLFDPAGMLLVVAFVFLVATAGGFMTDLHGWWRVPKDNNQIIKIQQQGTEVTILAPSDNDQPVIAGTFIDDTLWVFLTDPVPDTMFLVYANDTLKGFNELGEPLIVVRYTVDLTDWWRDMVSGEVIKMVQQGPDVTIWAGEDSIFAAIGTFADDTLMMYLNMPPIMDTLLFVYDFDLLRGIGPEEDSMIWQRMPYGLWSPVFCETKFIDGHESDWADSFLVAEDPDNDAINGNPSADFDKLFLCHDSANLYFRIDLVGAAAFPHSGDYSDRYMILLGTNGNDNDYGITIWSGYSMRVRNNLTGEETTLYSLGVAGNVIEGSVPLSLLGNFQRYRIGVGSEYYDDWIYLWDFYDRIELNVELRSCLGQRAILTPSPQRAIDAYRIVPLIDTVIIGDLEMYEVSEIAPGSIRINGAIQPSAVTILPEYPEFLGEVMQILFPAAPFIRGYEPMWDSTMQEFVVTGGEPNTAGALSIVGQAPFIGHRSGDANADGLVNIADVMFLVQYAFRAGATPRLIEAADANCDGKVNIGDAVYLAGFIFRGGPAPCHR
ncbi:MAG: hypothetical protein GYA46_11090 [candidate division Zixibacteria bacterium]|nr:hypothetical protein [candidate division Zixibacteria bacterium]